MGKVETAMNDKITKWWGICLIVIGITGIVSGIGGITGMMPDVLRRIVGIVDLALLPVFVFLTFKKIIMNKR